MENVEDRVRRMTTRELLKFLVRDVSVLVDRQMELARQEAKENLQATIFSLALLIGGGLLLVLALISLLVGVILALGLLVPGWLAGVILFVFFAVVGGLLALFGRKTLVTRPLQRTRDTLKEDLEWAKARVTSNGR
ncbi:MAG: phage holin family protein [Chloroflexi bacterium]|nr:phage holin family protein [Chloroflexota bacterium]